MVDSPWQIGVKKQLVSENLRREKEGKQNMTTRIFLAGLAALALVLTAVPRTSDAALLNFVETSASATSHTYDLVANAEGGAVLSVDFFSDWDAIGAAQVTSMLWSDCSGGAAGECDGVAGALFGVDFFSLGDFTWNTAGGPATFGVDFGISGFSGGTGWVTPSAVYGVLTVNHQDTSTFAGDMNLLVAAAPGSNFNGGGLADNSNLTRLTISGTLPEPATLVLLGMALGGLAFVQRRRA